MKIVNVYGSVLRMHGATKYLMAFASELERQGQDSSILCTEFRIPRPYWLDAEIIEAYGDSRGQRSSRSRLIRATERLVLTPRLARHLPADADAVVLHSEHALPLLPFVRRKSPKAVVVYYCYQPPREVYDLWEIVKRDFGPLIRAGLRVAIPAYRWIDRKLARAADMVLVFSPEYREYARQVYGDLNYVLVPAGIDFRMFEENGPEAEEKQRAIRGGCDHYLLMNAVLARKKNIDVFVRLLASLRARGLKVRGTVIGEGPLENELKALAERLEVEANFEVTGYVSQEDLPHYYHAADILYYLETNGAWSMSIIEAGAAKIPVVVAPGGSMPTQVRDSITGFVLTDVSDLDELTAKTVALLESRDLRERMGRNNYRHCLQFSLQRSVGSFLEAVAGHERPLR